MPQVKGLAKGQPFGDGRLKIAFESNGAFLPRGMVMNSGYIFQASFSWSVLSMDWITVRFLGLLRDSQCMELSYLMSGNFYDCRLTFGVPVEAKLKEIESGALYEIRSIISNYQRLGWKKISRQQVSLSIFPSGKKDRIRYEGCASLVAG